MRTIGKISLESRRRIAVGAGAAIGTLLRVGLANLLGASGHGVLWATFLANVGGSLLLGLLLGWRLRRSAPSTFTIPFAGIGLLGSFTTFSLFAVETGDLLREGRVALAAFYSIGSVVAGLSVAFVGERVGRVL
jgi:CrcB protein